MKGKNTFTTKEISDLKQLIRMRVNADEDDQKKIRRIMRSIGFYGSNYGIVDCQVSDLEADVGDKFPVVVVHGLLPAGAQGQQTVNDLPDFGGVFKRSFATGNIFFGSHNLFPLVHEKRMNKSIK